MCIVSTDIRKSTVFIEVVNKHDKWLRNKNKNSNTKMLKLLISLMYELTKK